MKRALVAASVLLLGCDDGSVPIARFALTSETAHDVEVELPAHVDALVPAHASRYHLRAVVAVPPAWRGRPLTLAIPFWQGITSVAVDGAEAVPLDGSSFERSRSVAGKAFRLPATTNGSVSIDIAVAHATRDTAWLDTVPRLSATERGDTRYEWTRAFANATSAAAPAMLATLGFINGIAFLADRRRRVYGHFALFALITTVVALAYSGATQLVFGRYDATAGWVLSVFAALAGASFFYSYYDRKVPRAVLFAALVGTVPCVVLASDPFRTRLAHIGLASIIVGMFGLGFGVMIDAIRKRRRNAYVHIVALGLLLAAGMPDILSYLGAGEVLGGFRTLCLGYILYACGITALLARDLDSLQVSLEARVAALDVTNRELRRQVAERSKSMADAFASIGSLPRSSVTPVPGDEIEGRYRVIRELGKGGMGAVYEIERVADETRLALKVLLGAESGQDLARLVREAQIAAEVHHPNVVSMVDVGVLGATNPYVVMELVRGQSLDELRARFGDRAFARSILADVVAGLGAVHAHGVIHRDLKPGNVLVADDGRARIVDFGIAAVRDVDPLGRTVAERAASPKLTERGLLLGTPVYMAPELALGAERASVASDVFALGVMAYELLYRGAPFDKPPVLSALAGNAITVPSTPAGDDLGALIARCLAEDPQKRPTLNEIRDRLAIAAAA